ncbi:MAG: hypothetical protein SFZ02_04730 [bacterium]|nr:hypothetical protein [bacterium]
MPYTSEKEMYPDIINWLQLFLKQRFSSQKVIVKDGSRTPLKRILQDENLNPQNKPEWLTFDILVDICGFIIHDNAIEFAFVECKNKAINLLDVSQLLGYSKVALPIFSCIVSPFGMSSDVARLLVTYNRQDILEYRHDKGKQAQSIFVATWSQERQTLDFATLIPTGKKLI